MQIDVLIPTYNNQNTIQASLRSIEKQQVPEPWVVRVILVDDGSTDDTHNTVVRYSRQSRLPLTLLKTDHKGAGHARNVAAKHSQADVVLLLGADIILLPGSLAAHCNFHVQNPARSEAALGFVRWDYRIRPTPLMEWMTHGGPQNDFDSLLGAQAADPTHFFYGSHVSLKRTLLVEHMFSEQFRNYGWEDLELGRRLGASGAALCILRKAIGLHQHVYTAANIMSRQYAAGQSIVKYESIVKHGLLPKRPRFHKQVVRILGMLGGKYLATLLLRVLGQRATIPRAFELATGLVFWQGYYGAAPKKDKIA